MPRLLQGSLMALMASAAYGLGLVVMRLALRDGRDPVVGSTISMLTATVLLAVVVRGRGFSLDSAEKRALPHLVTSGVCSALGVLFLYAALRSIPAVVAAPIHGTWPVMAVLLSAVFLKRLERITVPLVAGTLLVVLGLALVAVG
ncbi:MAG: EamA family transporter [Chloroflexi bacterium]|nr:EamA family transporter [Chloroflexota bacterium]